MNRDHPYKHYIRKVSEARELKAGEPGNCTDITYTKKVELEKRGIKSTIMACNLKSGEGHAFLLTDEGVLDNRRSEVITMKDVGCIY